MALIYFDRFGDPNRGIWVEPSNIAYIEAISDDRCKIHFVGPDLKTEVDGSAEYVANRIGGEKRTIKP